MRVLESFLCKGCEEMTTPSKANLSLMTKRRLEMFGFISSALVIAVLIVSYTILSTNTVQVTSCTAMSSQYRVNITDGVISSDNRIVHTDMEYPFGTYWTDKDRTRWGCPCMLKPCINKCCDGGEIHVYTEYTYNDILERIVDCESMNISFSPKSSAVYSAKDLPRLRKVPVEDNSFFIIDEGCKGQQYVLMLKEDEKSNAYLLDNGNLFIKNSEQRLLPHYEFCMESSSENDAPHFMICSPKESPDEPKEWTYELKSTGMLISAVFSRVDIRAEKYWDADLRRVQSVTIAVTKRVSDEPKVDALKSTGMLISAVFSRLLCRDQKSLLMSLKWTYTKTHPPQHHQRVSDEPKSGHTS
ncbi:hypothetical protein J6590_054429 [Homalodisca vitripennis]|nr:hypothetical protein J6590_054429 [Homalodisca vitripennis]